MYSEQNFHADFNEFLQLLSSEKKSNREIEKTKVVEVIRKIMNDQNNELLCKLHASSILYRARVISPNDLMDSTTSLSFDWDNFRLYGFDEYDSKEPPLKVSPEARNSIQGSSYLYLASDMYTACAEVNPIATAYISGAIFEITSDLKIIDFSDELKILPEKNNLQEDIYFVNMLAKVLFHYSATFTNEKGYIALQYISDYIRKYGVDGICYRSSKTDRKCYTIFNCCEQNVKFVKSTIIKCTGISYTLFDLEAEAQLEISNKLCFPIDKESCYTEKNKMIAHLKELKTGQSI